MHNERPNFVTQLVAGQCWGAQNEKVRRKKNYKEAQSTNLHETSPLFFAKLPLRMSRHSNPNSALQRPSTPSLFATCWNRG